MCLFPLLIKNKKYEPNQKNGGVPPKPKDKRALGVPARCGQCEECRKQIAREWQVRLNEEFKDDRHAQFVTLTFSEESLKKLEKEENEDANEIATRAVKLFINRWIRKYRKSIKHWLITELGHENTNRLHLHGILWTEATKEEIEERWEYGKIWIGEYCNEKTINYIVKYVTKLDQDHKGFKGKILCSKGLGKGYIERAKKAGTHRFNGKNTNEAYRLPNGAKISLPDYYRKKLWTEEEREELWLNTQDKDKRYILGQKITDFSKNTMEYFELLKYKQEENNKKGYGNRDWKKKKYVASLKKLQKNLEV